MGLKDTIQILDVIEKRDARYCDRLLRECQVSSTEILLSHKGIEDLCSFERFRCIDALWLNNNTLSRVQGLDTNVQIKALYLHCNRINTLKGSLQKLHHIRMLTLNSNMLQDLIATLPLLEHLHCLEELGASHVSVQIQPFRRFRTSAAAELLGCGHCAVSRLSCLRQPDHDMQLLSRSHWQPAGQRGQLPDARHSHLPDAPSA